MGAPAVVPIFSVYMGDPFNVALTFHNMDLRGFNYVAQIRAQAGGALLTTFGLSKTYVSPDTIITFSLAGDSAAGPDSITRQLGRSAVWDLQQYNTDGSRSDTLLVGSLAMTQDVTL